MIPSVLMNTFTKTMTDRLIIFTERRLTVRKAKRRILEEKNAKKSQLRQWVEAILWAVVFVFLINQFIFQLYQIPSSSMEDTLLIKDRVFVNKMIFGPEIYPGGPKLFDMADPMRDDIIIFQNPEYVSRGPVFDVANRIIYMLTLSLVNIDKDENGNPRAQLYVKRSIGNAYDTISFDKGEIEIRPAGYASEVPEAQFRQEAGLDSYRKRLFSQDDYDSFSAYAMIQAFNKEGFEYPAALEEEYRKSTSSLRDMYHIYRTFYETRAKLNPDDALVRSELARYRNGFYIPKGYVLPIGDNRDNSGDGRYFGPVATKEMLGKASFRFWPLKRIGILD